MVDQAIPGIQADLLRPPADLPEPILTRNAETVLERRYLHHNDRGEPLETLGGSFWRVAVEVAQGSSAWADAAEVEQLARDYYTMMARLDFLPNSPTLMNAGKRNGLQYSACYVLPVPDSMEGIFETNKRTALIHKSGGGTGFSFSRLRPVGDLVGSTGGVASGPISFLEVYNASTESVKQGGTRRGANMGILRVDHPDILDFIHCKRDLNERNQLAYDAVADSLSTTKRDALRRALLEYQISNFNISVGVTDRFMEAVANDDEYDLIQPRTGTVVGHLRAREVFDDMTRCAWETGDPGVVFLDRINAGPANPVPAMGPIEATNPCGEQPLYPNEACNLGSLNLCHFIKAPGTNGHANGNGNGHSNGHSAPARDRIDWDAMEHTIRLTVHFLDDVITVNPYPDALIDEAVKSNRRIGLGVMGWADLLVMLGIPYDSEEALGLGDEMMSFINRIGHDESERLAEVRGPFPNWYRSIYKDGKPLRNSTVTTIAPTGTISIIAGCSSGIEPLFALVFDRRGSLDGQLSLETNPMFGEIARREGFWTDDLARDVRERGTVRELSAVPAKWQQVFATAHDIGLEWHVRMQATWQRSTDNAVSKTINLPHDAVVADVDRAYRLAYETGCNGITVYRDGAKEGVLHVGTVSLPANPTGGDEAEIAPRPRALQGVTYQIEAPLGTAYVTINHDELGEPLEVFVNQGKAGSDIAPLSEAIGKLSTLLLRVPSTMPPRTRMREMISKLRGIGGTTSVGFGPDRTRSLPDALARVLEQHLTHLDAQASQLTTPLSQLSATAGPKAGTKVMQLSGTFCPDCGMALVHEEGCDKCFTCGYSRC
ncbi:MAG: ribonucleoside-diphosphate reductase alpha chain [Chloroflexota bacterium]|jgi:ribonucleoside-diphosphate reductase alpha chain|nr:ribonucleoside-diphosphate reductase alpha chain [Chloroflexota bacterium]